MKRVLALTLALTLLVCCLTACGGGKTLRFGTGGVGGTYYAYGNALAQMISEENESMSFSVKTEDLKVGDITVRWPRSAP